MLSVVAKIGMWSKATSTPVRDVIGICPRRPIIGNFAVVRSVRKTNVMRRDGMRVQVYDVVVNGLYPTVLVAARGLGVVTVSNNTLIGDTR